MYPSQLESYVGLHLRSADSLTFDVPRTRTRMGDRASSVAGPRAWNALAVEHPAWTLLTSVSNHICFLLLRSITTLLSFKLFTLLYFMYCYYFTVLATSPC